MDDPMGSAATVAARTPHLNDHAVTETITMHTVGKVCTLVRAAAGRAGVATRDIDDLLIAVSELVTNVIRHAGGRDRSPCAACPPVCSRRSATTVRGCRRT